MRLRLWLPALLCLSMTACPYGSPVPVDAPERGAVDGRLLGGWTQTGESAGSFAEIEFSDFNGREYYAEVRSHEPFRPVETERYRVFSSQAQGRTLLNCRKLSSQKGGEAYFLASYEFKDADTAAFSFVSDEAMKAAGKIESSQGLRRFLERHLKDKGFFEPGFVLKRRGDGPSPARP